MQTDSHTYGQFKIPKEPNIHALGMQEEIRVPGKKNPHMHRENIQTPCRKTPAKIQAFTLFVVNYSKTQYCLAKHSLKNDVYFDINTVY